MAQHTFEPEVFHNTFGSHSPVLHVDPGDTITTTTIDARGVNRQGERVGGRPNPQTGPFAVNGAEPGDTLVFTLDSLRPNRDRGFSSAALAANVLDFGYRPDFNDEVELAWWTVDADAGTVKLDSPANRLNGITLPLRPMLGCIGVAPSGGQAIGTMTSAEHGGNMDYNRIVAGIVVHFPVFTAGALFHLGDGHALQGDGEMDGTGVEISMDVTFTLDLIKGRTINWPRAEDDEYLMAIGNVRPLDQAVQHATTELVAWLESDYGLNTREAHMLLGRLVEYDLGNMYDPAYTMVAKIAKAYLRDL